MDRSKQNSDALRLENERLSAKNKELIEVVEKLNNEVAIKRQVLQKSHNGMKYDI